MKEMLLKNVVVLVEFELVATVVMKSSISTDVR
jgi:hypothetical protein